MTDSISKSSELIPFSVDYIKKKYEKLRKDQKAWALYVTLKLNVIDKTDIIKTIDCFLKYYEENYQLYCDDLAICNDNFLRDLNFTKKYIKWKDT